MASPILYHNADYSVILIDIPTSIEQAQQALLNLASAPPLAVPYPSTEPHGNKREVALAGIPAQDRTYHWSIQSSIREALSTIKNSYIDGQGGAWYRTRQYVIRPDIESHSSWVAARASPGKSHRSKSGRSLSMHPTLVPVVLSSTELRNEFPSLPNVQDVIVHNPRSTASLICFPEEGTFWFPPNATCIQSTLEHGLELFGHGRQLLRTPMPQAFDLILMDPPWANRSARRSRSYQTAEGQMADPFLTAMQIVRSHLDPKGTVAVWITNRSAVRKTVVETFRAMGWELFQDWIWVKITAEGQPVAQLDGIWRRPYEALLLFRSGHCAANKPARRVLAAVPDLHSRKPNLKILLEQHVGPRYEALELFARSLTAGWWSWGDEALRFQHESQWTQPDSGP